jgi:peptidoglycan/LPS O-acetylase OafA/YrhL
VVFVRIEILRFRPMKNGTSLYLDLVRFSAAFAVFTQHLKLYTKNSFSWFWSAHPFWSTYLALFSQTAVIVFFVLSGYVIAHVLTTRERTPLQYTASRFARLYSVAAPALILAAATNYLESLKYPNMFQAFAFGNDIIGAIYYLGTALFVNHFWLWPNLEPFNTPFWTLSFEVSYYIGIALLVFAKGSFRFLSLALLCAVAGPTMVLLAPTWLLGYWAYHFSKRQQQHAGLAFVVWLGATVALFLCPYIESTIRLPLPFLRMPDPVLGELLAAYAAAICFTVNIIAFNAFSDRAERLLSPSKGLIRWLGSMTFALYLFHQPLLSFFNVYGIGRGTPGQMLLMTLGPLAIVLTLGRLCERSKNAYKRYFLSMWTRSRPRPVAVG